MDDPIVRTTKELKDAVDRKISPIIVRGELARKVAAIMKIKAHQSALEPLRGLSSTRMAAAMPMVAAMTGLEIIVLVTIVFIGIHLVLALAKNYKAVKIRVKVPGVEGEVILERG
jgi:hypothetical protein